MTTRTTPDPHARDKGIATIGDTDRAGTLEVLSTSWDHNGTLTVVITTRGELSRYALGMFLRERDITRARRLAKKCLMHPEQTRSVKVALIKRQGTDTHLTIDVSRLNQ